MTTATTPPLNLLVAGGGIGGLAAAYVLGRAGHAVTVLEQAGTFGEIGAGIQLGPNIFRMFEYLGLTDAVSRVAFFPPGPGHERRAHRREGHTRSARRNRRAAYGYPYGVIYRVDLHQVFLDACKALAERRRCARPAKWNPSSRTARACGCAWPAAKCCKATRWSARTACGAASAKRVVGDGKPRVSGHIAYRAVLKREEVPAAPVERRRAAVGRRKNPSGALPAAPRRTVQPGRRVPQQQVRRRLEHLRRHRRAQRALLAGRAAGARAAGQDRDLEDVGAVRP